MTIMLNNNTLANFDVLSESDMSSVVGGSQAVQSGGGYDMTDPVDVWQYFLAGQGHR